MSTVRLKNVNPLGRVDLPLIAREGDVEGHGVGCLEPGEVFEVDAKLAGRAPRGKPGEKGYDPGEGLLSQVGNYQLVKAPAKKAAPAEKKTARPVKKATAPAAVAAASDAKGDS